MNNSDKMLEAFMWISYDKKKEVVLDLLEKWKGKQPQFTSLYTLVSSKLIIVHEDRLVEIYKALLEVVEAKNQFEIQEKIAQVHNITNKIKELHNRERNLYESENPENILNSL